MPLCSASLDELTIDDEASFAHVALYASLKAQVRRSGHKFMIPAAGTTASWDRALFLNLTYWSAEGGTDVLCDDHIPADVVAHVAWHQLAAAELTRGTATGRLSAEAMLFGECIASAFDLYLVGRLVEHVPGSDFIATQVPIMSEAAEQAGLPEAAFAALLTSIAREPERAFEDLRALLFRAGTALIACRDAAAAALALESFAGHRFEPLLHHYQLSNWVLYARAYAPGQAPDPLVRALDATLRQAPVSLDWLEANWIARGMASR